MNCCAKCNTQVAEWLLVESPAGTVCLPCDLDLTTAQLGEELPEAGGEELGL